MSSLKIRLIKALGNPRGSQRPTLSERRYRGVADSASYHTPIADSERPPKETAGRGLTSTLRPRRRRNSVKSENILRISRARLGKRPVRLESRGPGRAGLTARRIVFSSGPHPRELNPRAKALGVENITKRDKMVSYFR
ncbi:unnamed protein product [Laminaria digitata]